MAVRNLAVFGALTSGLGAVMSFWDAANAFRRDDVDASVAAAIAGLAYTGLAATTIIGGMQGASSTFFLGPWGWAFLAVGLVTTFVYIGLSDADFEEWAKHGPFAKDATDRMTDDWRYWAENRQACFAERATLFCKPTLDIQHPHRRWRGIARPAASETAGAVTTRHHAPFFLRTNSADAAHHAEHPVSRNPSVIYAYRRQPANPVLGSKPKDLFPLNRPNNADANRQTVPSTKSADRLEVRRL